MHDWTGIVLRRENDYPEYRLITTYNVDDQGFQTYPIAAERVPRGTWSGGFEERYICECGLEYLMWADMQEHLSIFDELEEEEEVETL